MAPSFWALRCCRCRLFQVQQAKRSGKWSCSVCGQRQAVQKVYGQGSGPDCRHHVQKLNLLQGEAEEAIGWTSRYVEESVNDSKNIAAQREDSSVQQEGRAEVSRWSKYLDKDSEDQEDGKEEADTEGQQFCSWRKNTVKEQWKQQKSFLSSDVQEHTEENGGFQLAYQTKKAKTSERKNCVVAVADQDDGDAFSGDNVVPAVSIAKTLLGSLCHHRRAVEGWGYTAPLQQMMVQRVDTQNRLEELQISHSNPFFQSCIAGFRTSKAFNFSSEV
ncbi:hypothetical protein llap_16461 [Limosa lapponica baueri]|uniref:MRN complex-interacting protein N-terminal domain-containing protein n=1 Tax=Limosa lapponica baueri TaxID=1758121 RepID=A0A2I0THG1_LIMLA|nr:hypothetical protein llap_16461 [Limosa lapponica baueri]